MTTEEWGKIEKDVTLMRDIWLKRITDAEHEDEKIYSNGVSHGYEVVLRMLKDLKQNKYPGVKDDTNQLNSF